MKQWYESLFENYAQKYDKECFVQGTLGECDFIEQELNYDKWHGWGQADIYPDCGGKLGKLQKVKEEINK